METFQAMTDKIKPTAQESIQQLYPIRTLSEKTGVGTSTLRAWERRYGLLKPERTPKGHRLYSDSDTRRVFKILDLLNDGHNLPRITEMLLTENTSTNSGTLYEAPSNERAKAEMGSVWDKFISLTLQATSDFNIERIDGTYNEASSLYPVDMVTDRLILPVIKQLGSAWIEHPERGVAEEHFYTSWLKNRLGARFHHAYSQARGARIICACVPGSYHEIGLMLFALSALARGYRVLYFGADLPFDQLSYIIQRSAAKAVVLSAQTRATDSLSDELGKIISQVKAPVFLGGSDEFIDTGSFQSAGGILLGANISIAMRVFESHIPAYSSSQKNAAIDNTEVKR